MNVCFIDLPYIKGSSHTCRSALLNARATRKLGYADMPIDLLYLENAPCVVQVLMEDTGLLLRVCGAAKGIIVTGWC